MRFDKLDFYMDYFGPVAVPSVVTYASKIDLFARYFNYDVPGEFVPTDYERREREEGVAKWKRKKASMAPPYVKLH